MQRAGNLLTATPLLNVILRRKKASDSMTNIIQENREDHARNH